VEVLDGDADPDTVVVQDTVPASHSWAWMSCDDLARHFLRRAAQELMVRLKREYDFIILDAPPVLR
jgi:cellulose biosynthesis protein BcsQ